MKFLSDYLGHLMGYLMSAATVVSAIDPKLLPPEYAVATAVAGALVTVGHHSYTAGGASAAITAAANAVASTAAKQLPLLLCAMLVVGSLSACKTVPTANQQAGIAVTVDIAAGYAIQKGSTDPAAWKARAVEYKAIAVKLQAVNSAGNATLPTLAADLQPLIAKLPPADILAANALVAAVTPYLNQQLQANPNVAATQAAVAMILQSVVDACTAYGG